MGRLCKQNETLTNKQDQYKGAFHTLNKEVTALTEKLKEEARLWEKEQEAKANLEKELTALCEQVETTRVDVIKKFKASQPFIDTSAIYYGDRFEDCLKKVRYVYPNLDLSKVTMDDPLPTTLARGDTVSKETDDSTESTRDSKNDGVVLAQPTIKGPVVPQASSTDDHFANDASNSVA